MPSGGNGGVTGGQKGWMGLVGRLRAARPLHTERKTRPLHRERHRAKEGQEMRPQSNPERQNCVKKCVCHLLLLQEKHSHVFFWKKWGRTSHLRLYDIKRSSPFSIWHATCICDTTKLLIQDFEIKSITLTQQSHVLGNAGSELLYGPPRSPHILLPLTL